MKAGFFRRIFAFYIVLFVLAAFIADRYVARVIHDSYINSLEDTLATEAMLIVPLVDFNLHLLDSLARELKEKINARVTFIARDGRVLGDSDTDSSSMENHSNRPEVQLAIMQGIGHSIRFSGTLKSNLLYTAVAVNDGGRVIGTVRLALPLTRVNEYIRKIRLRTFAGVGAVLIITGIMTLFLGRRVQGLVSDISTFSSAIAGGKFNERLMLSGLGEFEQIATNLNYMAQEIQGLIESDREKYERLAVILKSVPDVLVILDAEDRIMMLNKAAERMFGGTSAQGRPIREIFRAPDFVSLLDRTRGSGVINEAELSPERDGGRYFKVKASPIELAVRHKTGMAVVLHDITETKTLEKVRKDFVANVSHELKTPITAIKGFADTLAEGAINDRENASRFIDIIRSNSERIIKLVDDLMTLSRIELGVIKLVKKEVWLNDVVHGAVENFQLMAKAKGIELKTEIGDGPVRASADRDRVMQILSNLVDNAIKYTEKGSVTVGIGKEGGSVSLFVTDTGAGIPEKHIPRLGERFYRVDTSRSRELGGTGLGLAIVKHLVSAHGWRMTVESKIGHGTTVKLIIRPSQS